jgi:hypothetical protein
MAFPTNPTNGQTTTQNGINYTYNSTLTAWTVGTQAAGNISGNNINITSTAVIGTTLAVTGNINSVANIVATANVIGGNITTAGLVSAAGNITGSYLLGNAALVTGLSASSISSGTSNVNVVSSGGNVTVGVGGTSNVLVFANTGAFITGIMSASGNVSGGNLVVTGNIVDTAALSILSGANGNITLSPNGTGVVISTANTIPSANATYDLGSTTARWKTVFTSDLDLNNGIGDWTIVEGEDDLFLYNNKKGRVFKFALIEVDPATATPKIDGLK